MNAMIKKSVKKFLDLDDDPDDLQNLIHLFLMPFSIFPENVIKMCPQVILQTDRQTNVFHQIHNLLGRGNKMGLACKLNI